MVGNDFLINVNANTNQAINKLDELKQIGKEIEEMEISFKEKPGQNISRADIDKYISKNVDYQRKHHNTRTALKREYISSSANATPEQRARNAERYKEQVGELRNSYTNVRRSYSNRMKQDQINEGRMLWRSFPDDVSRHQRDPSNAESELKRTKRVNQRIQSELSSAERTMQNIMNTGYTTENQDSNMRKTMENFMTNYQGFGQDVTMEDILRDGYDRDWTPTEDSLRGQAHSSIDLANEEITDIQENLTNIKQQRDSGLMSDFEYENLKDFYEEELQAQDKIVRKNKEIIQNLQDGLDQMIESTREFNEVTTEQGGYTKKYNSDDVRGKLQERGMMLGMIASAGIARSLFKSFSEGSSAVEQQRESSMSLGMRTGDYDFRGIRRDNMRLGADLGFTGVEMLSFADSIVSNLGYRSEEELRDLTYNRAEAERTMGVDTSSLDEFMNAQMSTGSVTNVDQAQAIQDGFVGAIKASGMEGREQEQIQALTNIHDNLSHLDVSNEDAESRMAIANILASSGLRSLQGENLSNFMGSLDQSIQQANPYSDVGFMLGVGSNPEFMGDGGLLNYYRQTEQGVTSENLSSIIDMYNTLGGGNDENTAGMIMRDFGLQGQVSTDAVLSMVQQYNSGELDQESIDSFINQTQEMGGELRDERMEGYEESSDSVDLSAKAYDELNKSLVADNELTTAIKDLKQSIDAFTGQNAGLATGGALVSGITTGIASSLTGMFSTFFAQALFKGLGKTSLFGGAEGLSAFVGSLGTKGKALFTGAGGAGAGAVAGAGSTVAKGAETATKGADNFLNFTSGSKSGWLGKIGLGLDVARGVGNVVQSDDKVVTAVSETGRVGGGWAGAKGGALLGAKAGTFLGGPIGTALGTLGGGALGYFAGSSLGSGLLGNTWDFFTGGNSEQESKGNTVHASESDNETDIPIHDIGEDSVYREQDSTIAGQEEQANTSLRENIEQQRTLNISQESENLSIWDTLLSRMADLLNQARQQNGIVGSMDNLPNGGNVSGSGSGVGGELSYTDEGQYWTANDLTQHDLGKTVDTLTAGQLNEWINARARPDSAMYNTGEAFMKAGKESGLDPRYLVAHAAHETAWGTSNIVKDKGNFYGIGAFDATPYSSAYNYDSNEAGIVEGAKWIAENYYQKRGAKTLTEMNVDYATDPGWARKIANTMRGSESYTTPSTGNVQINTEVNVNADNKTDKQTGKDIGKEVNNTISKVFSREHRNSRRRSGGSHSALIF